MRVIPVTERRRLVAAARYRRIGLCPKVRGYDARGTGTQDWRDARRRRGGGSDVVRDAGRGPGGAGVVPGEPEIREAVGDDQGDRGGRRAGREPARSAEAFVPAGEGSVLHVHAGRRRAARVSAPPAPRGAPSSVRGRVGDGG